MKKSTIALISAICFLLGVITGFFCSPVKNGFHFVNCFGNRYKLKN